MTLSPLSFSGAVRTFLILVLVAFCVPAHAAFFYLNGGGGIYNVKTRTFLDNRYYRIYRQRYDFSCGSAALASLLTYSYEHPSDERSIINAMYVAGNKEKINHEGFSLLDMKNYLSSIGFQSNGYKASLDKLKSAGIPAIVLIKKNGYMHFVVIQGIERNKILLGDPALGKKIMDRGEFERLWQNHILFVIENNVPYARQMFNSQTAWHTKSIGKFSTPLPDTDLATMTLMTSYTPNAFRF